MDTTILEEQQGIARIANEFAATRPEPPAGGRVDARRHCAYNLTRECFLGLEVTSVDLPYADAARRLSGWAPKSGEGLWLLPFRGVPGSGMQTPLDLIYLDRECRVVETAESFPTCAPGAASPRVASVLALPVHSIYSSQTQAGDQLVLCVAEEMEGRLARMAEPQAENEAGQSAVVLREVPLWSGGPGVLELGNRSGTRCGPAQMHEMKLMEPGHHGTMPPAAWLRRWWSPDPRRAPGENEPGPAAYYWNGAAAQAHNARDLKARGLYVVTEERWYPATLILMTRQRTKYGEEAQERTIAVQSRAVRWGNDGVGLQFAICDGSERRRGVRSMLTGGAARKPLERFLRQLKKGKR